MNVRKSAPGVFVVLAALLLFRPIFPVVVDGGSMSPTYEPGERLVASKFSGNLARGDIVVFRRDNETYIKRIAFLAGDSYPEVLYRGHWMKPFTIKTLASAQQHHLPERRIFIPPHKIYVVGDCDSESIDSRSFGPIAEDSVFGKVLGERKPADGPIFPGAKFQGHSGWMEAFLTRHIDWYFPSRRLLASAKPPRKRI